MREEAKAILSEKLKKDAIAQRTQAGRKLDYIESHHAIREANRAFGFDGWDYEINELTMVSEEKNTNNNHVIGYIARVIVTVGCTSREDVGFGSGISKTLADAHEGATKEAVSDAMKRALRTFGDIFGLALYDKKQEHVEKESERKESVVSTKDHTWEGDYKKEGAKQDTSLDVFSIAIQALTTKDSAHKWKKENQSAIDSLGADKGKVMTEYLNKVKELN